MLVREASKCCKQRFLGNAGGCSEAQDASSNADSTGLADQGTPMCRHWHRYCWLHLVRLINEGMNEYGTKSKTKGCEKLCRWKNVPRKKVYIKLETKNVAAKEISAIKKNQVLGTGISRKVPWQHLSNQQNLTLHRLKVQKCNPFIWEESLWATCPLIKWRYLGN